MAKVALLVGVSEYEPGLSPLPAALKDVEAMQRVLTNPEMGGFDDIKILENPDRQKMEYEIEKLFSSRNKDDLVVLFFSGHGIKDDAGKLFFATRNTQKNQRGSLIRSTAVQASFVHDIMRLSRSRRQAIILDCCYSGAFDPELHSKDDGSIDLQAELGAKGRVVLTSSSSTEYSFEQLEASHLSIYTRYLVEGIETGAGDSNGDGFISIYELHEYAESKVRETAPKMSPKIICLKDKGFEIILSKARVTDPRLKYRKAASRYANAGSIRPSGRVFLNVLRQKLGLSKNVTDEIEAEILRPYQERLVNLQHYREALVAEAEREYPLGEEACQEMDRLQDFLCLRDEDILSIKQECFAKFEKKTSQLSENYKQNSNLESEINLHLTKEEMSKGVIKRLNIGNNEIIDVTVPPGVSPHKKLRIRGKGQLDPYSKERGDLYLIIHDESEKNIVQNKIAISKDMTTEALGVETIGGIMTIIIPQNTPLPTEVTEVFSTAVDGQANVEINVLKGNCEFAKDNTSLGTFRLDGIPPAPRGVPKIDVTFTIDENGLFSLLARDQGTGKELSTTIQNAT